MDGVKAKQADMSFALAELKGDVVELKANQLDIKSRLDLVLQIFNQKEDKCYYHGASFAFANTAPRIPVVTYQSPTIISSQVLPNAEVERGNSKRKQLPNTM